MNIGAVSKAIILAGQGSERWGETHDDGLFRAHRYHFSTVSKATSGKRLGDNVHTLYSASWTDRDFKFPKRVGRLSVHRK